MELDVNNLPEEITMSIIPMLSDYGYVTAHQSLIGDYVQIGDPVEVVFKLMSRDAVIDGTVNNLKAKAQEIRAEAEIKCKRIDEKIQSLLALPESIS